MKKSKKSSIKSVKNQIWELCKTIIRKKYGNVCYTCGQENLSGGNWQTGHFIPRSICGSILKYDLRNLRPQCYRCNIHAGGAGAVFYKRMVELDGQEYVDSVFADKKSNVQMRYEDFVELKARLEKIREELKEFGLPE